MPRLVGLLKKFLFLNGAEVNFSSESFCTQNNTAFKNSEFSAEMASGMKQALNGLTNPAEV